MLIIKEVNSALPQRLRRESRGNACEDAPVWAAVIGRLEVPDIRGPTPFGMACTRTGLFPQTSPFENNIWIKKLIDV